MVALATMAQKTTSASNARPTTIVHPCRRMISRTSGPMRNGNKSATQAFIRSGEKGKTGLSLLPGSIMACGPKASTWTRSPRLSGLFRSASIAVSSRIPAQPWATSATRRDVRAAASPLSPSQSPTSRGGLCNLAAGGDPARMVAMFQSPTSRGGLCNPVVLDGGLEGLIVFQSPTSRGGLCNAILNSGTSLWQAPGGPMSSFRRRGSNWEGMVNLPPLGPVSRLTTPSARSAQEI
jgi:hypothetical protein